MSQLEKAVGITAEVVVDNETHAGFGSFGWLCSAGIPAREG
jgi:hypothetical protein